MSKEREIIEKVFNKYAWCIKDKKNNYGIVAHNIDLGSAIRETIKMMKQKPMTKIQRKQHQRMIDSLCRSLKEIYKKDKEDSD